MNYTRSLARLYYEHREYPFTMGTIIGIPMFKFTRVIESEDDLVSRIKAYMQILGVMLIDTELDDGTRIWMSLETEEEG